MSNSDTERCFTPAHTTLPHEDLDSQPTSLYLSPPLANGTFIIRHPETNLVVTLKSDNHGFWLKPPSMVMKELLNKAFENTHIS
jgi:hypothetical protein